jgi:hypothetical protein
VRDQRTREQARWRSNGGFATIEGLQLLAETSSWIAGWLFLPAWLGLIGAGAADFLLYGVGAGSLLSLGVAVDRPHGWSQAGDLAWFTAANCIAVLVIGGAVFAIAAIFH